MANDERIDGEEVLDAIRGAGRKVLPMHTYLAHNDPATLAGFNDFLTATIYANDSLDEKYKEIVLACACVAAGSGKPVIAAHCRKAMEAGATRGEVLQALEITAAVFATRAMGAGVMAMLEVEGE
jgi:alkylhydroperoxidase/carboxymuconolactone decarboxylase family protein YurZ